MERSQFVSFPPECSKLTASRSMDDKQWWLSTAEEEANMQGQQPLLFMHRATLQAEFMLDCGIGTQTSFAWCRLG